MKRKNKSLSFALIILLSSALSTKQAHAKEILTAKTDLCLFEKNNWKILQLAVKNSEKKSLQALLDAGTNVDSVDGLGRTALMFAAQKGSIAIVELLLDAGANVNAVDDWGWSVLMHAIEKNRTWVVEKLVDRGANVNFANYRGWTALKHAYVYDFSQHGHITEKLKSAGARRTAAPTVKEINAEQVGMELNVFEGDNWKILQSAVKNQW